MKKILVSNLPYIIVIILLNTIIYANALHGEFVSDDITNIFNNPQVQSWSAAFTGTHRHLQYLVWGTCLKLFGTTPFPMHLVALVQHIINAFLLFLIVTKAYNQKAGLLTALLFSAHPVNSEAVDWISASIYLYLTFFLFSSVLAFTEYRKANNKKYLYLTYVIFVVAIAITDNYWNYIIPPFLLVYDQFILQKSLNLKKILELVPIIAFGALMFFSSLTGTVTQRIQNVNNGFNTPFLERVPYSVYMHAESLIYPAKLTLYHEGEIITPQKYQLMVAITVLIVVAWPIVLGINKKLAGLILLMYIAILPVFSPIQVAWFAADRYLYIPSAIFCFLVVLVIHWIQNKYKIKHFANIAILVLLITYSARTIIRNIDWQTQKNLWLATEKIGPNSPRVHNNLGDIFAREKNFEASIWHFKRAIEIQPYYADAVHNLGNTYLQAGDLDAAEQEFLASLEINPYLYPATYKLGVIAYQRGNLEEARGYFEQTLAISPTDPTALKALEMVNKELQK